MSKIIIADGLTSEILDHIHKYDVIDNNHERDMSNWLEVFDFTAFANKRYAQHLVDRNRLIIPDEDGTYRELVIKNTDRYSDANGAKFIDVISLGFYQDLDGAKTIDPGTTAAQSPEAHMRDILAGTEVRVGEVAYTGNIRTITRENYTDPFSALKSLANEFDLELNFRIEIELGKIVRYADLVERIGEWSGRTIEFGQDLQTISRKTDANNIVTALRVIGPEREDGTRLETIVEDEDARNRWGRNGEHIIKVYEPQSEDQDMTLERLTQLGRTELNKRINALVTWEASVTDLEHVPGMQNKKIRFGDSIRIKDTHFNPPFFVEARIFKQRRNIFNPGSKQVELGDFREYTIEEVRQNWQSIKEELEKKIKWAEIRAGFGDIKFTIISYKSPLKTAKAGYDSQYNSLYDNPDLEASIRGTLSYAKANYDVAYNTLVNTIDVKADAETLSDDDLAEVNALYADYEKELAVLKTNFELATDAIGQTKSDRTEDKANDYTDQRMIDINLELDDARKNIDEARKNLDEMNGRLDDAVVDLDEARDNIEDAKERLADLDTALEEARNQLNDKVDFTNYNDRIGEITRDMADKVDGEWVDGRLRVELDKLEFDNRNLIIRSTETENTYINIDGGLAPSPHRSTSDYIKVEPNTEYAFSKSESEIDSDAGFFRWAWYDENKVYIDRRANSDNVILWVIPDNVHFVRVSYPKDSYPKFEKGKATSWQPAPEDIFSDLDSKANAKDVYVKADIDGMFDNTVSYETYRFDRGGYLERFRGYETNVEQTWDEINARLKSTEYDADQNKLENRLATWEATAEGFEQTVSEVRADLDGIEIGGRNLLRDTALTHEGRGAWANLPTVHTDDIYPYVQMNYGWGLRQVIPLLKAGIYTISVLAKEGTVSASRVRFSITDNNQITDVRLTDEWQKVSVTFTVEEDTENWQVYFLNSHSGASNAYIKFTQFQLERGNRATDWSPAPEDSITYTETRVKQLSDEWSTTYIKNDEVIAGIRVGDPNPISGANVEITGDTAIYGELTAPDAVFKKITVDEAYIVNSEIENMTITGTQNTENAIFQRGEFRKIFIDEAEIDKATIIDSDLENVRITGEMTAGEIRGVDIYGVSIEGSEFFAETEQGLIRRKTKVDADGVTVEYRSTYHPSNHYDFSELRDGGLNLGYYNGSKVVEATYSRNTLTTRAGLNFTIDSTLGLRVTGTQMLLGNGSSLGLVRSGTGSNERVRLLGGTTGTYLEVNYDEVRTTKPFSADRLTTVSTLEYTVNSHAFIRPRPGYELRVADVNGTWRPVKADSFPAMSSELYKTNIAPYKESALELLRESVVYDYERIATGKRELGFIIERETPEVLKYDEESINTYTLGSLAVKGIQELDTKVIELDNKFEDEISWLKTENQLLKNELKKQKYRIEQLEELVA